MVMTGNPRASEVMEQNGMKGNVQLGFLFLKSLYLYLVEVVGLDRLTMPSLKQLNSLGTKATKYYM